jgi:SynChlorMet cassette radical SAM/SPASM protein ScmF
MSLAKAPPLRTIYFYITNACNLRCAHCWLSMQGQAMRHMELTTGEIKGILDQALPLGLTSIKLTGGEPFLRDDIADIVDYAGGLGLSTRIETNATLLDDAAAKALGRSRGLGHVAVSLDGAGPEAHALLRGSEEAFDLAVRGIERLVAHGVKVEVITCLHRGNLGEMERLVDMVADLGAYSLKINPIIQVGRGQEMTERGEAVSLEQVLDLSQQLDDGLGAGQRLPIHMTLPVAFRSLRAVRRQGLGSCGVLNLLGVLPDGELSMCGIGEVDPNLVFGHARQQPIQEVWERSPGLARIRQGIAAWPTGLCRRCMMRRYCTWGACRAEAYAILGSLAAPHPFCQASFEAGLFPEDRLLPEVEQ